MTTLDYNVEETVIASGGNVYVAPVGTSAPADATTEPADPWENVGYISVDGATFTPTRESTTHDSWQQKAFRIKSSGDTYQVSFALLEFTADNFQLAFGGGVVTSATGSFTWEPPDPGDEYARAVVIDAIDGDNVVRLYLPNAGVAELGEVTFNADNLATLPVTLQAQAPPAGGKPIKALVSSGGAGTFMVEPTTMEAGTGTVETTEAE